MQKRGIRWQHDRLFRSAQKYCTQRPLRRIGKQYESNPHRPVRIVLNKAVHKQWEYIASKPKAFPEEMPRGHSRFGAAQWPKPDELDGYANKKLDEHASQVMANIEEELVQVYDVETSDNHGQSLYRGRGKGLRIKKVAADTRISKRGKGDQQSPEDGASCGHSESVGS